MSPTTRYRSIAVIVGLGALFLAASLTVPTLAKKKNKSPVLIVNSPPVVFSQTQLEANGSPFHGVTDASCPGGYRAVGTGGKWTPDRGSTIGANVNLGEQNIESAAFTSPTTVHFRVADDVDNGAKGADTFVGQVVCLKK